MVRQSEVLVIGATDYQYARLAAAICEVAIEDYKDHLSHAQKAIEGMNKACSEEYEMFKGYGDNPDPDKCEDTIEKILHEVNLISKASRDEQLYQNEVDRLRKEIKKSTAPAQLVDAYGNAIDRRTKAGQRKRNHTSDLISYLTAYLGTHYSKTEWECLISKFYDPALKYRRFKNKYLTACLDISRDEAYIHSDQWEILCTVDPDMAISALRTQFNFEENYKWKLK